jgi:2-polyprenyl-6-hydroxyphenyl methylase/3-demethylubiquinone-9 3-methyltransferase
MLNSIRPSELAASLRTHQFDLRDLKGMTYNPITQHYALSEDTQVNYLMHARYEPS